MKLLNLLLGIIPLLLSVLASPLHHHTRRWPVCCSNSTTTRVDFTSMPPEERQSFTTAIQCMISLPSQLDQDEYPAAISRYFDYAVIHVSRSQYIHSSGYFLTWHRYFLHLFENDLRKLCNYTGRYPYWNFAATASSPPTSLVFDGSQYSMSGDGLFTDNDPIQLGPNLTLPHGTGGGCVTTGPFANLSIPMKFIPTTFLQNGTLPADAYALNPSCLTRDLNVYTASTYTNNDLVTAATHATTARDFEIALNSIIGAGSLGIHSSAHFQVGGARGPMSSIHVSVQDPIWFPMHTFVDLVYDSW